MQPKAQADQLRTADRRSGPRAGRRADDQASEERERREQLVVKYLRKQEAK